MDEATDIPQYYKDTRKGSNVELIRCELCWGKGRQEGNLTPVEGIEISPVVILKDADGQLFDDDDHDDANPNGRIVQVLYTWFRGPLKTVCHFHQQTPSVMQCVMTKRCFCCEDCYIRGFRELVASKPQGVIAPTRVSNRLVTNDARHKRSEKELEWLEFDTDHYLRQLETFVKDSAPDGWSIVSNAREYVPTRADIARPLKLEVIVLDISKQFAAEHCIKELRTQCVVPHPPPIDNPRSFVIVPAWRGEACYSVHNRFTILSWNVLADIYSNKDAFPYCEAHILSWPYRRQRILSELLQYMCDIICLQEVQREHLEEFFLPELAKYGYDGVYKQKTMTIFTTGSGKKAGGKYTMDGCATFFKKNKFATVETQNVEFNKHISNVICEKQRHNPSFGTNPAVKRLLKDNVALILLLEEKFPDNTPSHFDSQSRESHIDARIRRHGTPNRLVVANTHIAANPELTNVKMWQTLTLVQWLETLVAQYNAQYSTPVGTILTGDFNCTPISPVYEFLSSARCNKENYPTLNNPDPIDLFTDVTLAHSLPLLSTYSTAKLKQKVSSFKQT
eukprot:GHVL01003802.1.p1 GENE.GHVL01003802.1~~GHVL01003802.1.p1  ORF type:complete len:616 (-),score=66.25 GHVL01003802.1:2370-4061(-)